jgi:pimeloyl-ACP methyl ester carboxylesterase
MPLAKLNEIDIYYELHGHGEPLVLIAGYSCDHTFWAAMLDTLIRHFQVLIFDNRGIGKTKDSGHAFTLENMAEDTFALINHLGLKRPHIVGQSMGGAISQIFARKFSHQINKLVILNSMPKVNLAALTVLEAMINLCKENIPFERIIDVSLPWFYSSHFFAIPKNIDTLKKIILNNPYPQSIADLERQYHAVKKFDSSDWLHEIKASTHVIVSENDIVTLPSEGKILQQKIPGATLTTITGGHSSPVENPRQVNQEILNFLIPT